MAILKKCDGCGIVSPTEDGLHIANHWVVVTVDPIIERNIYTETKREFLLCELCFGVRGAVACKPWLSKLTDAVRDAFPRYRRGRPE